MRNTTATPGPSKAELAKATTKGQVISPQLLELEETVKRGPLAFLESGRALAKIRDEKHHREAGYRSFDTYCRERFGMTEAHASRLISAVLVVDRLGKALPMGKVLEIIQSERQARAIRGQVPRILSDIEKGKAPELAMQEGMKRAKQQQSPSAQASGAHGHQYRHGGSSSANWHQAKRRHPSSGPVAPPSAADMSPLDRVLDAFRAHVAPELEELEDDDCRRAIKLLREELDTREAELDE